MTGTGVRIDRYSDTPMVRLKLSSITPLHHHFLTALTPAGQNRGIIRICPHAFSVQLLRRCGCKSRGGEGGRGGEARRAGTRQVLKVGVRHFGRVQTKNG